MFSEDLGQGFLESLRDPFDGGDVGCAHVVFIRDAVLGTRGSRLGTPSVQHESLVDAYHMDVTTENEWGHGEGSPWCLRVVR